MLIREMYSEIRPRERAIRHGVSSLNDAELLAILISKGTKKQSALEIANSILKKYSIKELQSTPLSELVKIKGIGEVKALNILAAFELFIRSKIKKAKKLFNSNDVYMYVKEKIKNKPQEHVIGLFLDEKKNVLHTQTLFIGTVNKSLIYSREIVAIALKYNATSVILAHNHPSGDSVPSEADINVTVMISNALEMVQIKLLDHLVIGSDDYSSITMILQNK